MKKLLCLSISCLSISLFAGTIFPQTLNLEYSTYLGGNDDDDAERIAVDSLHYAYVVGSVQSLDFPTKNAYQPSYGGGSYDAFVSKLSTSGSSLVFSTYLGGADSSDHARDVEVDGSFRIFITGDTWSEDFPTANPYQSSRGGTGLNDGFVTKFSSTGTSLLYSTYLGGSERDSGYGIEVDDLGYAFITGETESIDFPTQNVGANSIFQPAKAPGLFSFDVFVAVLRSSGGSVYFSTYLGGAGGDEGLDIAIDSAGNSYITGTTSSFDFPTANAYQTSNAGSSDGFISKLTNMGSTLTYSTYLGGGGDDYGSGIALDSDNYAYITGYTSSADFPTYSVLSVYQPGNAGGDDAFVSVLRNTGSTLYYSTYLGGENTDCGNAVAVDSAYLVYVTGYTFSTAFPTSNSYQSSYSGLGDVFLTRFSGAGSSLTYSTYLGGSFEDEGCGISLDSLRRVYLVGNTRSSDFPTKNAYQASFSGGSWPDDDIFVAKFIYLTPTPTRTPTPVPPTPSPTPSPMPTATPVPPTPSPTPTPTPNTPTPIPNTPTPIPNTPSPTPSSMPTATPVLNTPTPVPNTPTPIPETPSPTPSSMPTATPVPTPYYPLDLVYSTYLGGDGTDYGYAVEVDGSGCVYLCGSTGSDNFPASNPYQPSREGSTDVFLSKFSSTGTTLIYSTYLGGSSDDSGWDLALDSSNRPYLSGKTYSDNFPVCNAYQTEKKGGEDAFVSKLSSSGSWLEYSTYLGGSLYDQGYGIAVDTTLCAYVSGHTESEDFPTWNAFQPVFGGSGDYLGDAFVSKLSSSGSSLVYSTYLGGSLNDESTGIALNTAGGVSVTGTTQSTDFPRENAYQWSRAGGSDVFLSRFSPSGTTLIYSTYLGGSTWDYGGKVAVGFDGCAYICGFTASSNFPVQNPYQSTNAGSEDAFVSKFSSSGSLLVYSTYLGGGGGDYDGGIAVDDSGYAYLCGWTGSADFPVVNPYQPDFSGGNDVFVTGFSSTGSTLLYSTYLGGSDFDRGWDVALAFPDRVYVTGYTGSDLDFPLRDAYQPVYGGGFRDAFLSGFSFAHAEPTPAPASAPPWIYDYNGDGTSDIGIFRGSSGLWAIRGMTRVYFGSLTDETVPGDYNGDGTTEIGIFRPASGLWAIRGVTRTYFGGSIDETVPGDYNGDGTADIGIFRNTSGLWAVRGVTRAYFGGASDLPVPGYYSDGTTQNIGIFRGSSGLWAIRGITRIYFGGSTDQTVPGDYSGEGSWSAGIFRPGSGLWAVRGVTRSYFGSSSDDPVPADYSGAGTDDIGIFRPSSGLWAVKGVTRVYFGGSDDLPVTR